MASFDENGKYIKTNWKAGDKITATKLNKIEESIEAVNDNDISRHVEADARLDALEAKDVAHDKELTNIKNTIADNKAAAELGDYDINSRMTFLEEELNDGIEEVRNMAETVDGKIAQGKADMEAMVDEVESEMNELKNDMTNAQTQTFTVTDAYKFTVDHDGMTPSLVTLNNIEGLSNVETNNANQKFLVNNIIHDICTIDIGAINYFDYITSTEIFGNASHNIIDKSITITGDNSQGWSGVRFNLNNLTEGKRYCLFCDNVAVNSGGSGIEIVDGEMNSLPGCYLLNFPEQSANNIVFTAKSNTVGVGLFCTAISGNTPTQGSVTYENIQIYEVKEMIVPDIQLNSLPNGVKDEIKDGMLIKRTGMVELVDSTWTYHHSSDTTISFYSILDNIALASEYYVNDNNILSNIFQCTSTNVVDDFSIAGDFLISGYQVRPEIKIRLPISSGVSDVDSLIEWLRNNEAHAVYELATPEYIPVNLTIKADKGDTVVINTTKTMDFAYDIQLNTRAQIDTLQTNIIKHTHSEYIPLRGGNVTGTIKPAGGYYCDLGSTENKWRNIYSHSIQSDSFEMFIEDNEYTSQLHCSRGNFRLTDGYNTSIFSWSHNYSIMGPDSTNQINLGSEDFRFKSLYLNAQPNVSSDRTLKENIKYVNSNESNVSYEDMYAFVKDYLELATYNLVEHDKLNMGFIAQDLLVNLDGTDNKVGQMIVNPVPVPTEEEISEGKPYPTLSYDTGMYTSVLAGALKEAINKIEQLEARINELENK